MKKIKGFVLAGAKTLVLLFSLGVLYNHLFISNDINSFVALFREVIQNSSKLFLILLVFLLMIVNWTAEALKWQKILWELKILSIRKSIESVLSGLALGVFTPNRIGELGGKVMFLENEKRIKGMMLAGFSGVIQVFFTLLFGGIGLIISNIKEEYIFNNTKYSLLIAVLILTSFLLYIFRKPIFRILPWKNQFEIINDLNKTQITFTFILSLLRYVIFLLQFFILLSVFDISLNLIEAVSLIPLMFLAITIIPSFAIADIGTRGAVSVYIFENVSSFSQGIIAASLSLWIINLALPSIIGNIFILKYKPVK